MLDNILTRFQLPNAIARQRCLATQVRHERATYLWKRPDHGARDNPQNAGSQHCNAYRLFWDTFPQCLAISHLQTNTLAVLLHIRPFKQGLRREVIRMPHATVSSALNPRSESRCWLRAPRAARAMPYSRPHRPLAMSLRMPELWRATSRCPCGRGAAVTMRNKPHRS
jgi:hypothetical protein